MFIKTHELSVEPQFLANLLNSPGVLQIGSSFLNKGHEYLGNTFITIPALERFLGKIKCLKAKLYPVSELPR